MSSRHASPAYATNSASTPAKESDYNLHLNFLAAEFRDTASAIYRRKRLASDEERPHAHATAHKLPDEKGNWVSYWISPEHVPTMEPYHFAMNMNADVARRLLFWALERSVRTLLTQEQYHFPENAFIQEVSLIMRRHPEGDEALVVQPYTLRALKRTGFLVDFHFRKKDGVPFGRKIQQLSLSLDRNGRRNIDYCLDKATKIRQFLRDRWAIFESLTLPGATTPIAVSPDLTPLPAERLRPKSYVFAGGKESRGQFIGLREHGPLHPLTHPPRLLFAFREQDRQSARHLAASLRGGKQRGSYNFPGFQELFKTPLEIDSDPIILPDLSVESMRRALEQAQGAKDKSPDILPVLVLPSGDDNGYLAQKALFSHAGLPTQVCTLRILEDEDSLKWAIGNLALQIFCKAGGQPWKVRPTAEHSLIIGISQSHKWRGEGTQKRIDKYFAFSVLTESSGLFQQIEVLGDSSDHGTYVRALCANLTGILRKKAGEYRRVVIHTSFKLKHDEIAAIQRTVRQVAEGTENNRCRFAVIKVNHKSRFFGINEAVNSLVPYESSKVRLGPSEYLIWFEGIFPDKPTVTKAFAGPTHLEFLKIGEVADQPAEERELLQDLVNLSGANWRGFNAKSAPVSVFYCHLVADLVHNFHERGLPLPAVHDLRPWFL